MKKLVVAIYMISGSLLKAQPYVDVAKIGYTYSPSQGVNKKAHPLWSQALNVGLNIPLELRKGGDAFLINPFFDNMEGRVSTKDFHVMSQGVLLGFLKKDLWKNWNVFVSFVARRNKQVEVGTDDAWQYGGVLLATWKRSEATSMKFGIYYNKEFFGNYVIPLLGIDWKINSRDNLFGVLPGGLTFEHKRTPRFYYGASFRALTNSYRLETIDPCFSGDCTGRNYLRIDDNQLGLFADQYLSRSIFLSEEVGYTILRRYRYGFKGESIHTRVDYRNDNFYCRIALGYRIRFR